jgi:hypothetical protein
MSRNGKNELMLGKHRSLDDIIQAVDEVNHKKVLQLAGDIFGGTTSLSLIGPKGELPKALQ